MLKINNPAISKPLLFLAKLLYVGSIGKKYEVYKVNKSTKFKIRVGSMDKPTILDIYRTGEYERHGFKIKNEDVVVDLGAHIGSFSVLASRIVGKKGKVYSFEPDKHSYELLRFNKEINKCSNIKLSKIAVWKNSQPVNFHSSELDSWSSSIYRSDLENEYKVKTKPLPLILKSVGKKVDFLKIDVEGVEFDIFKNLVKKDLKNVDKIVLEFHDFIRDNVDEHKEIVKKLESFGYKVAEHNIFPLSIKVFGLGIIAASK